jgi:hypothetical protein
MPRNSLSTLPHKNATTVLCTKARPQTLLAAAPCLQASKFTAMAGALLTPRKAKFQAFSKHPSKASICWLFSFLHFSVFDAVFLCLRIEAK